MDLRTIVVGLDGSSHARRAAEWAASLARVAGATVVANLSASDITVGKADYRRLLCASQSAKCVTAYLYSAAGPGEILVSAASAEAADLDHSLETRHLTLRGRTQPLDVRVLRV